MYVDGFLELPDARMCYLLRDCWKDGAVVGECKFFKAVYHDEARRYVNKYLFSPESWEEFFDGESQLLGRLKWEAETMIMHMLAVVAKDCVYPPHREKFLVKIIKTATQRDVVPLLCTMHSDLSSTNPLLCGLHPDVSFTNKIPGLAASLLDAARAKAETDVPSQFFLGLHMANALEDTHQEEGMDRVQKAADQGNPQASHLLGLAYFFGRHGVPINRLAACGHFARAAAKGHAEAALTFGKLCLDQPGMMPMAMQMFQLCFLDHSFGRPVRMVQAAAKKIYDAVREVQRKSGVPLVQLRGEISDPLSGDATFLVYAMHE